MKKSKQRILKFDQGADKKAFLGNCSLKVYRCKVLHSCV